MAFDSAVSRQFRSGGRALAGRFRALSRHSGGPVFALVPADIAPDQAQTIKAIGAASASAQQHPADN